MVKFTIAGDIHVHPPYTKNVRQPRTEAGNKKSAKASQFMGTPAHQATQILATARVPFPAKVFIAVYEFCDLH